MYRVTVSARFEAAHNLIDYEGGPEPLHGHSYKVEAVLAAEKLQRYDVAVDFVPAKKALEAILAIPAPEQVSLTVVREATVLG